MGLLSDSLTKSTQRYCRVVEVYHELAQMDGVDDEDLANWRACVDDPGFPPSALHRVAGQFGISLHHDVVTRHRRHGDCGWDA